uniref:Uncharacterized protein n=1 Tax=Fagus sylvatica TaxID=28930 RepID=A0A2N9E9N7_FAGSY
MMRERSGRRAPPSAQSGLTGSAIASRTLHEQRQFQGTHQIGTEVGTESPIEVNVDKIPETKTPEKLLVGLKVKGFGREERDWVEGFNEGSELLLGLL